MVRSKTLFNFYVLFGFVVAFNLDTDNPIIYEIPDLQKEGGYFGMSVAIRPRAASLENSWTIQVGAPHGDTKGMTVEQPGTVYRCRIYGPCIKFQVDSGSSGSGGKGIYAYKEKKDGAWIGVSMDIKEFHESEKSIICAHRWINQNLKNPENIDITYLMTGACYMQDLNGTLEYPVQKLLPLVNRDKIYTPNPYVVDLSTYHWGLGQAGFSVWMITEPLGIMIGAPGVTHWVGSVVYYGPSFDMLVGNFARTEISRKSRYIYLGYSVTAGRFYKDRKLWFVAGAPRSANYHGEVFIFRFKDFTGSVQIQSNLVGSTFGEYFGSALATCDVNGDGFDDLIVGAPLYSNRDPDEGRIYVYFGTDRGNFMLGPQVIHGEVGYGRFGLCTSSLGDIDQDGRGDVAIGAPYEDNLKGAVYIYRGSSAGLESKYSQRISAEEIFPHLRGFGISISSPVDIDGNKYQDIAAGAYLSGHVVLLRSRPVVSLHPKIKTEAISLIDRKNPYLNITLCSRYAGRNAPAYLDILRETEIDPVHGRGSFDATKTSLQKKLIRLRLNEIICEVQAVTLNLSGENYSPLQIIMKNEVFPCTEAKGNLLIKGQGKRATESDGFSKWCPLGNKAETSKELPFAGVCGSDNVCNSDLKLSCNIPEFRTGTYILGSSEHLTLMITVQNLGEPAYNTKIKISSNIRLNEYDFGYKDSDPSRKTFWLLMDGTLADNYQGNFSFHIPLESLQEMKKQNDFLLVAEIFTSSSETNLTNNNCRLSVKLLTDALLNFYSSSSTTSLLISKRMLQEDSVNVTHFYEIQKIGVTQVTGVELTIYIPHSRQIDFLTFTVETSEGMYITSQDEEPEFLNRTHFLLNEESSQCPPTNRTVFLNCTSVDIQCQILNIIFTGEIQNGLSLYVKIIITLNISAIDSYKEQKDITYISTMGSLRYWNFFEDKGRELHRSASVSLYREEGTPKMDGRAIALSILAGGGLLCVIVTALVKSNFFKRSKKEQLKALKDAEESFIYFANGANSPTM